MARRCELSGKGVQSGNNVSHANNKTRRRFLPNLQHASMTSDALGQIVRLRVTPYALRAVDKRGGLDSYLLATGDDKLSLNARRIKRRVRKAVAALAADAKDQPAAPEAYVFLTETIGRRSGSALPSAAPRHRVDRRATATDPACPLLRHLVRV